MQDGRSAHRLPCCRCNMSIGSLTAVQKRFFFFFFGCRAVSADFILMFLVYSKMNPNEMQPKDYVSMVQGGAAAHLYLAVGLNLDVEQCKGAKVHDAHDGGLHGDDARL